MTVSADSAVTPSESPAFALRPAEPRDLPAIVALIGELAEFEQLTHLLQVTPDMLRPHLFGERPVAEAMVADVPVEADAAPGTGGGHEDNTAPHRRVVAFALFFTNFSTFLSKPGLYLEDLYVQPAYRRLGLGRALLSALGRLAVARDYGRFEWSVLDWNENAIRFYERMGARVLPEWRICRVAGEALQRFGQG
jgi:GNAT superfamily N-acetyltransferase